MSNTGHGTYLVKCIFNWVLGFAAPTTWWISNNIDLINKYMEFGLRAVSMVSFSCLIIINRRKVVSELKCLFSKCQDEEKLK